MKSSAPSRRTATSTCDVHRLTAARCLGARWSTRRAFRLARDLRYTLVYLYYNSGLPISTDGRSFAALLERLVAEWPALLDELVILSHSRGGLVARSACHSGEIAGHRWRPKLRKLICLA